MTKVMSKVFKNIFGNVWYNMIQLLEISKFYSNMSNHNYVESAIRIEINFGRIPQSLKISMLMLKSINYEILKSVSQKLVPYLQRIFPKGFFSINRWFVDSFFLYRIIVYAITNYDIQTNEMLTTHQLNNNKHPMGLNADLLKVRYSIDWNLCLIFIWRLIAHSRNCIAHKYSNVLG